MLDVRTRRARRWIAAIAAVSFVAAPSAAEAASAEVAQEDPTENGRTSSDRALAEVGGVSPTDDTAVVAEAIESMNVNVSEQLDQLDAAQAKVDETTAALATADSAVANTELLIEELVDRSDAVVIEAFINPPAENALDVMQSDSVGDATIKQALLDMQADESAAVLEQLGEQRAVLEEQKATQDEALAATTAAKQEADTALVDLRSAVSQRTLFVAEVRMQLASEAAAAIDPDVAAQVAARRAELTALLDDMAAEREAARLAAEAAEAERRAIAEGRFLCPVRGEVYFTDTWGAARSGGRTHQGTDMMADTGTPTVAPVSGRVVHKQSSLGGLTWYVYGDDGNTYYGAHLSQYASTGVEHVDGGTVIGYVGTSGNAAADAPHLHFEFKPGGGASVNPYSRLAQACPGSAR
ncbi:MAG TPA: peptidoglycan DD-metalloendopeptidase family protein [Acidimicrobiales bacterium]|nr:peptidoglycan DD-metalloendopeptidase family protein [Acidimicrobiales bacterium]